MVTPPQATAESQIEMQNMNRGVRSSVPLKTVTNSLGEGMAIMGIDGSITGDIATYSWVISTQQDEICADVKGGGFLPATAQYLDPYSKQTEAAALFAGLTWIHELLMRFPNPNPDEHHPKTLPIPVDNDGVVKDVHWTVNDQAPT